MSPKLNLRIVKVEAISDGIAILQALGEGKLMVSTEKRNKTKGFFEMAECHIGEVAGKSETEVFELLDKRTEALERTALRLRKHNV